MLKLTAEYQPSTGKFRVVDAMGDVYASGVTNFQTAHALAGIMMAQPSLIPPSVGAQRRERNRRPAQPKSKGAGHINYRERNYGM